MDKLLSQFSLTSLSQGQVKALLIAILVFLAVIVFAAIRKYLVKSTIDGVLLGIFFGFLLTLILEGFLLIAGRTALTELLGWKDAPKPISTALDIGNKKLKDTLGVGGSIPTSNAGEIDSQYAVSVIQSLNPEENKKVRDIICTP